MARSRTLALKVETEIKGLDKLGNLGKELQNVGRAATTFVTLPLLAAGAAAINFASDLEEATNKATTVFGDASADMIKESENLNDAFSQAEFLDLSGTFGSLLKNMEFTTQEAKDMSSGFLDLAADMASFHNADPTEAIQAIRSALAGEFEPLKRFGVALNVATIEAKALEMGLWDGTGAIDANTRALVVQAELLRQQPDLIGDWDRTLGGAANQQRLLTKNFQDAAAAIGQELLPVATQLITQLNEWVKAFKELSPETREMIVRFAGIAAAAGPVLFIFGSLLRVLGPFAKLVGPLAATLGRFSTALGVSRLALLGWIGAIGAAGIAVGQQYGEVLDGLSGQILRDFAKAHGIAADEVTSDVARIADAFGETIPEAQERLLAGMNGVAEDYDITVRGLTDSTNAATGDISDALLGSEVAWENYQNQITAGSGEFDAATRDMAGAVERSAEEVAAALDEAQVAFSETFGDIIAGVTEVSGGIEVALQNGETIVGTSADTMMGKVSAAVERAEADAVMAASNIPGGIAQALTDNAGALQPALDTMIGIMDGSIDVMIDNAEIAAAQVALAQAEAYIAANPETAAAINSQMVLVQNILDEAAIQAKVTAGLSGTATIEEQARAMALSAWLVEQEAMGIVDLQSDQWERAVEIARERGYDTPEEFAAAMRQATSEHVDPAAAAVRRAAVEPLEGIDVSAGGAALIQSFINGMNWTWAANRNSVWAIGATIRNAFGHSLPTEGPLAGGLASGGESIIESWFSGMDKAARREMGTLTGIADTVGAALVTGGIADIPRASAVLAGAGGTTVYNTFNLRWDGEPPKGRNEEEIIGNLQRLSPLVGNALVGGS